MATILSDFGEFTVTAAPDGGDSKALWLTPEAAAAATGWSLRPEGLCRGDVCVPVPKGREQDFVADGNVNIAAFWAYLGMPAAHSQNGDTWVLGEAAENRAADLRSLQAPDFSLPDMAGASHSLSDYRGRKVLLATWASW